MVRMVTKCCLMWIVGGITLVTKGYLMWTASIVHLCNPRYKKLLFLMDPKFYAKEIYGLLLNADRLRNPDSAVRQIGSHHINRVKVLPTDGSINRFWRSEIRSWDPGSDSWRGGQSRVDWHGPYQLHVVESCTSHHPSQKPMPAHSHTILLPPHFSCFPLRLSLWDYSK